MNTSTNIKLMIAGAAVLLAAFAAYGPIGKTGEESNGNSSSYYTTLKGTMACLPHKGPGPSTMECAYGLQTEDNKYYALRNLPQEDVVNGTLTMGEAVTISGKVTTGGGSSQYDIVGTIDVDTALNGNNTKPNPLPNPNVIKLKVGQKDGPLTVTHIYPDRVDGLAAMEYPVAREDGTPVTLHVGEQVSNGCTVMLTLMRIEGDNAVFSKEENYNKPCPICLALNTMIDTPTGAVAVQNIHEGSVVWSIDVSGNKIAVPVKKVSKTPVSKFHQMIVVTLHDGRIVSASPNHPTTDGRVMSELKTDTMLDGSKIESVKTTPYTAGFTYDLLPESETGFYFADGVLLDSTLNN